MPISYLDDIHLHDASELQIGTVSGGQSKIYKNGAFSSWNCIDASGFEITHGASNRWITGMPAGEIILSFEADAKLTTSANGVVITGDLTLGSPTSDVVSPYLELREAEVNGTDSIKLKAPASMAASVTYILPGVDGSSGEVMTTDGSGTLSWAAGGSGTDTNIAITDLTLDATRTLDLDANPLYFNSNNGGATNSIVAFTYSSMSVFGDIHLRTNSTTLAPTMRFAEGTGANYNGLKSPDTLAANQTYILPTAVGNAGDVLSVQAAAASEQQMEWVAPTTSRQYRNQIVTHACSLVPNAQSLSADEYVGGTRETCWSAGQWVAYSGTGTVSSWPSSEIPLYAAKIGRIAANLGGSDNVHFSGNISAENNTGVGTPALSGRIYILQFTCSNVMGAGHNADLTPTDSDFVAWSIPDVDTNQGDCVTLDFVASVGAGDYYMVVLSVMSTNLGTNDQVIFNYQISQTETSA